MQRDSTRRMAFGSFGAAWSACILVGAMWLQLAHPENGRPWLARLMGAEPLHIVAHLVLYGTLAFAMRRATGRAWLAVIAVAAIAVLAGSRADDVVGAAVRGARVLRLRGGCNRRVHCPRDRMDARALDASREATRRRNRHDTFAATHRRSPVTTPLSGAPAHGPAVAMTEARKAEATMKNRIAIALLSLSSALMPLAAHASTRNDFEGAQAATHVAVAQPVFAQRMREGGYERGGGREGRFDRGGEREGRFDRGGEREGRFNRGGERDRDRGGYSDRGGEHEGRFDRGGEHGGREFGRR